MLHNPSCNPKTKLICHYHNLSLYLNILILLPRADIVESKNFKTLTLNTITEDKRTHTTVNSKQGPLKEKTAENMLPGIKTEKKNGEKMEKTKKMITLQISHFIKSILKK